METIANLNQDTVTGLKKLVKMNHDACNGFRKAADSIDRSELANLFAEVADQRERFRDELRASLQISDESAPDGGTIGGTIHGWWLTARAGLNDGDAKVVLLEASRGESSLLEAYEDVLVDTAGSPLNAALHRHIQAVKLSRDRIDALSETIG